MLLALVALPAYRDGCIACRSRPCFLLLMLVKMLKVLCNENIHLVRKYFAAVTLQASENANQI